MATEEIRRNILKSILEVAEIAQDAGESDIACALVELIALAEHRREVLGIVALNNAMKSVASLNRSYASSIPGCDELFDRIAAGWGIGKETK